MLKVAEENKPISALIESSNGQQRWITLRVSTNIVEASYQAVVEGIKYGLLLKETSLTTV